MQQTPQNQQEQQQNNEVRNSQRKFAWQLAGAATEFAFYIAVPLLVFVLWIEPKFNPGHKSKLFMAVGLLICLGLSAVTIAKTINDFRKKLK